MDSGGITKTQKPMKQKLFTLLTLLVLCVTGAWGQTTFKCKLNGSVVQERNDGNSGDFFSFSFSSGSYGWKSGTDVTGCTYDGVNYTSAMKFDSKPTLSFTTTQSATVIVVQSTSKNSSKAPKLDNTEMTTSESITGANVWTKTEVSAGTHTVKYNTEIWIHCVYVIYPAPGKAYKVTATSNNTNWGTASSSESSLDKGEKATITATPKAGYEFTSWDVTGEGASLSSNTTNPTTLTIGTADATVTANFTAINYAITHNDATGGTYTISVAGGDAVSTNTTATIGQTITLAGTPTNPAETAIAWNVKDADNNDVTVTNNQFTMPAKAVTISPVFSEPIVLTTFFSMTNITGPTESLSKGDVADVEATFTQGGSAEVFQNASSGTMFFNNNSINLNGSSSSYLHVIFPNNVILQAGDVIDAELLTGALKVSASTSSASSITLPYTIKTTDTKLIGATGLYFFKNGSAQVTSVTIKGQGAISDFAITSSTTPTVAIGNESTITYTSSSTGAVTFTSSDNAVASITDGGVITAKEGGTATITINQDADETYRAALAKITVTVPEVVFVKIKTLGGSSTKVTGTMDVTTGITADVNLSSNRKMDKGKYVGFTLNGENAIQTGDIIEVKLSAAGQGGKFIFYDSKGDNPTELYNTNVSPDEAKVYRFVVPAAMNGVKTTYLRRDDDSGINVGFNPFFEYIAICRPSGEITLNASGYATYSSATNFLISGAKAYEATLNTADKKITCTEVEAVPAGAGVLLFGDAGAKVAIINTTSADALTDNDLKGTTQADGTLATFDTAKYYYALSGDTFKHYTGSAFVENKAYFESDTELNSKAFTIVFDGETTGINAIEEVAPVTTKTRKVVKNGRLVIETANGEFTVSGARIK